MLSHCAHFVESQHSVAQHESAFSQAWSQPSHSVHSTAFSELLLHAHEAAANIAATTANDINTFFMVTKKFKELGVDIETIVQATGLSVGVVEGL